MKARSTRLLLTLSLALVLPGWPTAATAQNVPTPRYVQTPTADIGCQKLSPDSLTHSPSRR